MPRHARLLTVLLRPISPQYLHVANEILTRGLENQQLNCYGGRNPIPNPNRSGIMATKERSQEVRSLRKRRSRQPKVFNRLLEYRAISEVSYQKYRDTVREVYDGPQGAVLVACSLISLHTPLGERMLRTHQFDLRGAKRILDVGSGAGQIAKHLLKYADSDASVTCFDLSLEMLRRARIRLKSDRPNFVASDMTQLPFADEAFDCATCGYVLEHVPEPRDGLAEIARVLAPGGRMLLLATEDSFSGAWTSRLWRCQTYNRAELKAACEEVGLHWHRELWFSRFHKMFRAGGICVELVKG